MIMKTNRIAFQGEFGANSDMASRDMFPNMEPLPCQTFEDAFLAVENGDADLGMIPIENTIAGRVADIHHLLPESRLHIVGEYFMPIRFQLMVLPGVTKDEIRTVHSHIHALGQCRKIVRLNGWKPVIAGDTAGAAKLVAETGDRTMAALAPRLAADLYGLSIRRGERRGYRKQRHPLRRAVARRRRRRSGSGDEIVVTTFVFNVRNIPAALYKALGGFATNGINMTKLESYQIGGKFYRHAVLCRYRRPPGRAACPPGAGGAALLLRKGPHPRHLSGPSDAQCVLRLDDRQAGRSRPVAGAFPKGRGRRRRPFPRKEMLMRTITT
jgi:prephenate dehydratase